MIVIKVLEIVILEEIIFNILQFIILVALLALFLSSKAAFIFLLTYSALTESFSSEINTEEDSSSPTYFCSLNTLLLISSFPMQIQSADLSLISLYTSTITSSTSASCRKEQSPLNTELIALRTTVLPQPFSPYKKKYRASA